MNEEGAKLISLRNEFYRDSYRLVMVALLLLAFINICLLGIIYYQFTHKPIPQYFAISADGKIIKLESLSKPVYNDDFIRNWAANTAVNVHSYDFVSYRERLEKAGNNFTPEGWRNFLDALKDSRQLDMVREKHLISSAVPTGTPVIVDQGTFGTKIYNWKVQTSLLITYESGTMQTTQTVLATMLISRVPTENNPQGIAVSTYYESVEAPGTAGQ